MKYQINLKEFSDLKEMGYQVHQFSNVHYRVTKDFTQTRMEVFPTRKSFKLFKDGYYHKKNYYTDLLITVETLVR